MDELSDYVEDKKMRVTSDQEALNGPISLYEAMARGLKYNLDHHVELMEVTLRQRQLRLAHFSMLPGIVANAGYTDRNNYTGGRSVELLGDTGTGNQSLRSSTSSERDLNSSDLSFSWHVLDFGLSYIRAQQSADQTLIAEEQRRKVVNRIVEDVRTAYWKAVTATRLVRRLGSLERRVKQALRETKTLSEDGQSSPLTALTYERELVEIERELRRLNAELSVAKAQLAALINIDPGTSYSVVVPRSQRPPAYVGMSAEQMVMKALHSRSELREVAYNTRINNKEAEAALIEMLPGVSLQAAPNWNSNEFLFNNHWLSWGAKASWNLIKVFNYPARRAVVRAKDDLLDQRALAVTMAIMTQVHVSRARLIHARRKYSSARHYYSVQSRILNQINNSLDAGKVSEQTAIREEMNTLVARVKLDLAFVELQNAFANIYASMGIDPYADFMSGDEELGELSDILRNGWRELGDRHAVLTFPEMRNHS